jgi:hypothetical protein
MVVVLMRMCVGMSVRMRMSVAMSVTVPVTARSMCVRDSAAVVSMSNTGPHKQATGTGCD